MGSLHVARDITEKKQAEKTIQETESRFRRLLANVDFVAVQGYNMEGVAIYWNQASEILYGYTKQEALGQNLIDLIIPDEMRSQVQREIQQMTSSAEPVPSSELTLKRKDGSLVPVFSSHTLIRKHDGSLELFCVDIDLTEIKKTQNNLLQAKKQAEAANIAKSEFLANMSHEIRTPLNGIMGMLQLLSATGLNEDQEELVNLGSVSGKRLTQLLSDILELSSIDAGKMIIRENEFNLHDICSSIKDLFIIPAREKGIDFSCSLTPSFSETLIGDDTRVQQILVNLMGNAIKFTDKGSVSLSISPVSQIDKDRARVFFSIADTGTGIPEDKLDDLFKPFSQADGSLTRQYQGAGLGLVIVHRLVNMMGGSISVESEPGQGTTVHVS
ncbi:MAG: PAS domain-containing sensor histidine kinase, partial [Desulfonatronovibrio sp.]